MKKRFNVLRVLAGMLCFIMTFSSIAVMMGMRSEVMAEEGDSANQSGGTDGTLTYGNFEYSINDDGETLTITKYTGGSVPEGINVPAEIDGKKVTTIGSGAFMYAGCTISIPEGVTTIKGDAFTFSRAREIYFPSTIVTVEDEVFFTQTWPTIVYGYRGNIIENVANSDEDSNYCVFRALDKLDPVYNGLSYKINDDNTVSITGYDDSASEIMIPSSIEGRKVKNIDRYAFYLSRVNKVTMEYGIESIEKGAFYFCTSLMEINIPASVTEIGFGAFSANYSLEKLIIPESVTKIDNDAFNIAGRNESVTVGPIGSGCNIEYGWTSAIPYKAFCNTSSLTEVWIGDSITSVGEHAFSACDRLKTIHLPDNLKNIGNYAFNSCPIEQVTIPEGVERISDNAFKSCSALTSVTVLGGATNISDSAFADCTGLAKICGLTGSEAEKYAIDNNIAFESIGTYVAPDESETSEEKEYGDFKYTVNNDGTITITKYIGKNSSDVDIPQTIEDKNVTVIGENAFEGARLYGMITIPEGVTTISSGAFFNSNAEKIVFPRSVTTIADSYLNTFFYPTRLCAYKDSKAYEYLNAVEDDSHDTILMAIDEPYGVYGDFNYKIKENGTVALVSYNGAGKSVEVPGEINGKKVTHIYKYCFAKSDVESVKLPDGIERIGARAFNNCSSLVNINIPDTVTRVDMSAFTMCPSLKKLVIPASVTQIQQGAFAFYIGDTSASDVTAGPIGSGADIEYGWTEKIPGNAFDHSNITEIVIPESVAEIGNAFFNCVRLKKVTIEGKDTEIYNEYGGAFENCSEFVIYGTADSKAEAFAKERGYTFKVIGSEESEAPEGQVSDKVLEEIEQGAAVASEKVEAGKESYLPKNFIQAAKDKGAVIVIDVEKAGKPVVTYTIDGRNFDGVPDSDFKLDVTAGEKNDVTASVKKQLKIKDESSIYLCEFAHSGNLNGQMTITMYTEGYESGTELKLYYYNEETGRAEDMNRTVTVSEDGSVSFDVTHFSSYLLVKADAINTEDTPALPSEPETEPSETQPSETEPQTEPSENPSGSSQEPEYTSPHTGFSSSGVVYIIVIIMICGVFGMYQVKGSKRD